MSEINVTQSHIGLRKQSEWVRSEAQRARASGIGIPFALPEMATEKTPLLPDGGPEKTTTSSKRSGWSGIIAGAAVGLLVVFCIWRFAGSGKGPALVAVIPGQDKADVSGCAPVLPAADESKKWTLPDDPDDAYGAKSAADAKYAHGDGVDEDELPGIMARTSFRQPTSKKRQNTNHPHGS